MTRGSPALRSFGYSIRRVRAGQEPPALQGQTAPVTNPGRWTGHTKDKTAPVTNPGRWTGYTGGKSAPVVSAGSLAHAQRPQTCPVAAGGRPHSEGPCRNDR